MKHTQVLAPKITLYWDDQTGIAWIEDFTTGKGHAAHPNIKRPRTVTEMQQLGYWGKDERTVKSQSFIYNIDRLVIDEPLDDVARQHCRCGGNHTTQRWYDLAQKQWVDTPPEGV